MEQRQSVESLSTRKIIREFLAGAGIAVLGFLVGVIGVFLMAGGMYLYGVNIFENVIALFAAEIIGLQVIGFGGVALAYLWYTKESLIQIEIPSLRHIAWIVIGLVSLFVALIFVSAVELVIGVDAAEHGIQQTATGNPEILLLFIPITLFIIGPAEELLFRGIIQRRLVDRLSLGYGILFASIIFAVAHAGALIASSTSGFVFMMGVYVVLGAILGITYEITKNIVVPIVIHGIFNALQAAGMYFALTNDEMAEFMTLLGLS